MLNNAYAACDAHFYLLRLRSAAVDVVVVLLLLLLLWWLIGAIKVRCDTVFGIRL